MWGPELTTKADTPQGCSAAFSPRLYGKFCDLLRVAAWWCPPPSRFSRIFDAYLEKLTDPARIWSWPLGSMAGAERRCASSPRAFNYTLVPRRAAGGPRRGCVPQAKSQPFLPGVYAEIKQISPFSPSPPSYLCISPKISFWDRCRPKRDPQVRASYPRKGTCFFGNIGEIKAAKGRCLLSV